MFDECRADAVRAFDPAERHLDYPVAGQVMFALGAWGLLRSAMSADGALTLLALADRFGYNQTVPTLAWGRTATRAEESAPGRLATLHAHYRDREPRELLDEARALVEQIPG